MARQYLSFDFLDKSIIKKRHSFLFSKRSGWHFQNACHLSVSIGLSGVPNVATHMRPKGTQSHCLVSPAVQKQKDTIYGVRTWYISY
jgi:hypothetical protein